MKCKSQLGRASPCQTASLKSVVSAPGRSGENLQDAPGDLYLSSCSRPAPSASSPRPSPATCPRLRCIDVSKVLQLLLVRQGSEGQQRVQGPPASAGLPRLRRISNVSKASRESGRVLRLPQVLRDPPRVDVIKSFGTVVNIKASLHLQRRVQGFSAPTAASKTLNIPGAVCPRAPSTPPPPPAGKHHPAPLHLQLRPRPSTSWGALCPRAPSTPPPPEAGQHQPAPLTSSPRPSTSRGAICPRAPRAPPTPAASYSSSTPGSTCSARSSLARPRKIMCLVFLILRQIPVRFRRFPLLGHS